MYVYDRLFKHISSIHSFKCMFGYGESGAIVHKVFGIAEPIGACRDRKKYLFIGKRDMIKTNVCSRISCFLQQQQHYGAKKALEWWTGDFCPH